MSSSKTVKSLGIAYFVLCLLFFTACSNNKKNEHSLRLAYIPNVTHAVPLVGIKKNFFQESLGEKIKLKPVHFVVGNSIIDAFITNQIDIAYIGPGPYINALYRKVPIKLLSNACNGGTLLVGTVVNPSLNDGLRIAVPQYGNTQDLLLRVYLEKKNLSDKTKVIAIPSQDVGTTFFTMSLDAACLPEPWGTILLDKKACSVLADEKEILNNGNYPTTVLVVNKNYAEKNPDAILNFLSAHNKTIEYINEHNDESVNVITESIKAIAKKEVKTNIILKAFKRCSFTSKIDSNILKEFKIIGVKTGYYKDGF